MRLKILGWYNQRNIGDEAFKDAFKTAFAIAQNDSELDFGVKMDPEAAFAVLGAGDVVRPYYLDQISDTQPLILLGCGLGYESEIELLKKKDVRLALMRNVKDVAIARSHGIRSEYCPDLTFVLSKPGKDNINTGRSRTKSLAVLLTDEINPTFERRGAKEYLYYEYFKWELAEILDVLSDYYNINFVAFSTLDSIDDRKINHDIYRRMSRRENVRFYHDLGSAEEGRSVVASHDLVLSMKFHGIMFACASGVPFVNIAETRKTQLFCEENGLEKLSIASYSLQKDRFLSAVKIAESNDIRALLETVAQKCEQTAQKILPTAISLITDLQKESGAISANALKHQMD